MQRPFLVVIKECNAAVRWASERFTCSGLQVMQTFNLQTARSDQGYCSCPHHGSEQCDCQMVVLLVYAPGSPPASVIAHGHAGQTWFTLLDSPGQTVSSGMAAAIHAALAPNLLA